MKGRCSPRVDVPLTSFHNHSTLRQAEGTTEAQLRFGHRLPGAYCLPNIGLGSRAQKISSRVVLTPFPRQRLLLPCLACIPGKLFQNTLKKRSALLRYFPFFSFWRPEPAIGAQSRNRDCRGLESVCGAKAEGCSGRVHTGPRPRARHRMPPAPHVRANGAPAAPPLP